MINKIEELRSRAAGYDIVGIVETNINDSELNLPGYTMYRGDRTSGRGGGVIICQRGISIHSRSTFTCPGV